MKLERKTSFFSLIFCVIFTIFFTFLKCYMCAVKKITMVSKHPSEIVVLKTKQTGKTSYIL